MRYATTKNIDFPSGRAAPGQARATYEDGMLRVDLPLSLPEPRSRSVPIDRPS